MPLLVLQKTASLFALILVLAVCAVFAYHNLLGDVANVNTVLLVSLLTSAVALPVITYVVFYNERFGALLERLDGFSRVDPLTGVLTREGFNIAARALISQNGRDESAGAFLYVDADHFKSINDTYGHHTGDHALAIIGATLRAKTRESDLVARLGGEEFGVFLRGVTLDQARNIAERIRQGIECNSASLEHPDLKLTVSIGLVIHERNQDVPDVMRAADERLYEAKHAGRNRIICATSEPAFNAA